jgi:hypothetical protein
MVQIVSHWCGHCGPCIFLTGIALALVGVSGDSGEGGSKSPGGSGGESTKQDAKNGKEPIHWHNLYVSASANLSGAFPLFLY